MISQSISINQSMAICYWFLYCDLLLISGVIGFCIAFGIIIGQMGHQAKIMIDFFQWSGRDRHEARHRHHVVSITLSCHEYYVIIL